MCLSVLLTSGVHVCICMQWWCTCHSVTLTKVLKWPPPQFSSFYMLLQVWTWVEMFVGHCILPNHYQILCLVSKCFIASGSHSDEKVLKWNTPLDLSLVSKQWTVVLSPTPTRCDAAINMHLVHSPIACCRTNFAVNSSCISMQCSSTWQ